MLLRSRLHAADGRPGHALLDLIRDDPVIATDKALLLMQSTDVEMDEPPQQASIRGGQKTEAC